MQARDRLAQGNQVLVIIPQARVLLLKGKRFELLVRLEFQSVLITSIDTGNAGQCEQHGRRDPGDGLAMPGDEAFESIIVVDETENQHIRVEALGTVVQRLRQIIGEQA